MSLHTETSTRGKHVTMKNHLVIIGSNKTRLGISIGAGGRGQLPPSPTFKETCNIGRRNLKDKLYSTQYNC